PPVSGSLASRKSKRVPVAHAVVRLHSSCSLVESATTVLPTVTRTDTPVGERDDPNTSVPLRCGPDGRWLLASAATVTDGVDCGTITAARSSTVLPRSSTTSQACRHGSRCVSVYDCVTDVLDPLALPSPATCAVVTGVDATRTSPNGPIEWSS